MMNRSSLHYYARAQCFTSSIHTGDERAFGCRKWKMNVRGLARTEGDAQWHRVSHRNRNMAEHLLAVLLIGVANGVVGRGQVREIHTEFFLHAAAALGAAVIGSLPGDAGSQIHS